jgi:hypothetical protein
MFRFFFLLGLICTGGALAAESDDDVKAYLAYFKNLGLPYVEPRGCNADAPCSVVGDFNDDGALDLAILYEFRGEKARRAGWNLDLVILYSQGKSAEPTHMVFSHVGQVDTESNASASSLAIQEKGSMKVPSGEISLERPGINVIHDLNTGIGQFLTFYWREDSFYAIDKSDD